MKNKIWRINLYENEDYIKFVQDLKNVIDKKSCENDIIFLCIGTDRVIGDCIGPITGSLLKVENKNVNVYGDLTKNLTFNNINQPLKEIKYKFKKPFIITVDSALSDKDNVGRIYIENERNNYRKRT